MSRVISKPELDNHDVDVYYMRRSQEIVDSFFDNGLLADDLTRETIDWIENFLGFYLEKTADVAAKSKELELSIKRKK